MKSAQICYASPEFQLTKAAVAALGQWYRIPTWGYAGCTDSKVMDEQAALEAFLSVFTAKLSGANLIHDVGYMESGLTASLELIVLTDELVALCDQFLMGIQIDDHSLMLEEIDQVGPGGHYLTTDNTLSHFKDFWYPGLIDRQRRPKWLEDGGTTLGERLNKRVLEIIDNHKPETLAADKKDAINAILQR
jgi:trimethylamine--corrinoid protein Co-methyltransferase